MVCSECVQIVFRVCSECVQSVFRMSSACFQGVFRVCLECVQCVFRVCSECVQSMFRVCSDLLSRLVVKIVVIASSSASSVSVFGFFWSVTALFRPVKLTPKSEKNATK